MRSSVSLHELVRLLKSLAIGSYPVRPPPAAVPETAPVTHGAVGRRSKLKAITTKTPSDAKPSDPEDISQIPVDWDDWPAAG